MFIKRYFLLIPLTCLCFIPALVRAQAQQADTADKVKITISNSGEFVFTRTDSGEYNKFIHDVVLYQGTDTLYCDSLYQNNTTKNFEAFGDVRIAQQGGTQGTSDYLKYTTDLKQAYMEGNVALTDGKNKLRCEKLTYNLGTKIAIYDDWGTLHNDSTTVTSKSGVYNSNTKESRFTTDVIINDPQYKIRSEDLVYNSESKLTHLYSKSTVTRDAGKSILQTTSGTYDGVNGVAYFPSHSSSWYDGEYIEGDTLYYNKLTSYGFANGHVICIDTEHHSTLWSGHAEYFTKKKILWATLKPVLGQVNNKDTLYMRADTFYSAPMVKVKAQKQNGQKSKPRNNSLNSLVSIYPPDTLNFQDTSWFDKVYAKKDTLISRPGYLPFAPDFVRDSALKNAYSVWDSTVIIKMKNESLKPPKDSLSLKNKGENQKSPLKALDLKEKNVKTDSLARLKTENADTTLTKARKTNPKSGAKKTLAAKSKTPGKQKTEAAAAEPVKKRPISVYEIPATGPMYIGPETKFKDTTAVDTSAPLYFIGYHHVLIFSDSLQGKCDSMCYTRYDSAIRMIYAPIAWAHNSQITGDTILMRMDSASMKSMYVPNNAFVVSRSGPVKAKLFDQVQGRTLTAWFRKNSVDSMLVVPDAESIYYTKDEKDAYLGVDQSKSVLIRIYFDDQKIMRIKLEKEATITMTPLEKADLPNMKLSRFKWLIDQRPKNKEELFK